MSRHLLFFVHGMGSHDHTWHQSAFDVLSRAHDQYPSLNRLTLAQRVVPIPIVYDDLHEKWRTDAGRDFAAFRSALLARAAVDNGGEARSLDSQLDRFGRWAGLDAEPHFLWSHVADVLLYRWVSLMRTPVDASVAGQIVNALVQHDFPEWSVIAHSLGTSVIHNVLHMLYTSSFNGAGPLSPGHTRPRMLAMVANVSRVLERPGARVYRTQVRPQLPPADGLCRTYLNIRHQFDPVVLPHPFIPDVPSWLGQGMPVENAPYQHIEPRHLHFHNDGLIRVHDLDHHLLNPDVHVPIFRALFGASRITPAHHQQALGNFRQIENPDLSAIVQDRLRPILAMGKTEPRTLISVLMGLHTGMLPP